MRQLFPRSRLDMSSKNVERKLISFSLGKVHLRLGENIEGREGTFDHALGFDVCACHGPGDPLDHIHSTHFKVLEKKKEKKLRQLVRIICLQPIKLL